MGGGGANGAGSANGAGMLLTISIGVAQSAWCVSPRQPLDEVAWLAHVHRVVAQARQFGLEPGDVADLDIL